MAEAVGVRGIRLERPQDVESGLAAALAHNGPVLVDAVVNRRWPLKFRVDPVKKLQSHARV
jgi:thiamine pyrophosphate-dependent acetolactate synthase large subunit-like protein